MIACDRRLAVGRLTVAAFLAMLPIQIATAQVGGVYIDAKGMLRRTATLSPDERLKTLRTSSVRKPGTRDLADGSPLRRISLKRLQQLVKAHHTAGKPLPTEVRFLAGLTRVRYVFFDPREKDVIVAGPAEGWQALPTGEVVGKTSGRPVLHLDDLIIALRYAFTEKNRSAFVGCSIEPTEDGRKRFAVRLRKIGGRIDRSRQRSVLAGLEAAMGPQAVKWYGVDPSSRFALTMLVADYRLKRIAMGHDKSPVRAVSSYLDIAAKRAVSKRQPQHRWWFVAGYDAIEHTADRLAFELKGQGVKVATAVDIGTSNASAKKKKRKAAPAAAKFAENFTRHYAALARQIPVFAELQNLIGLSVVAELAAQRYYGEAVKGAVPDWAPVHFVKTTACPVEKFHAPKQVPSLATGRQVGRRQWLISVSGGVEINLTRIATGGVMKPASGRRLSQLGTSAGRPKSATRWWWD